MPRVAPPDKRSREDDDHSSPLTAPTFTGESFHINTNVLCGKELTDPTRQVLRAVRELLLNSLDQDDHANPTVIDPVALDGSEEAAENNVVVVFRITNHLRSDASYGICRRSFEYRPNEYTSSNAKKSGKFGYGLKDALAMLQYNRITYVADGPSGRFESFTDKDGLIHVRCLRGPASAMTREGSSTTALQTQELLCERKLHATIVNDLHLAVAQCLPFRNEYRSWRRYEVTQKVSKRPLGVILIPPEAETTKKAAAKVHDLFVAHQGYAFTYRSDFIRLTVLDDAVSGNDGGSTENLRPPLACVYQLFVDKSSVKGRDRVGLPTNWNKTLEAMVAAAPDDVLDYLLSHHNQNCYERIKSTNISNALVNYSKHKTEEQQKLQKILCDLDTEKKALQRKQAALVRELDDLEGEIAAGSPLTDASLESLERQRKLIKESLAANSERIADLEKHAAAAAATAHSNQETSAGAGCRPRLDAVVVVHLRHWEPVVVEDEAVTIVTVSSASDPLWHSHPTVDEYRYLLRQGIPTRFFSLLRLVQRLLLLLSLDASVGVENGNRFVCERLPPNSTPTGASHPQTHRLVCRFDTAMPRSEFLWSVVIAIAVAPTVGVYRPLLCGGMSVVETVAHVAAEALLEGEEDPRKLKAKRAPIALSHSVASPLFCPMLVCTEWDNKQGGISSFNIQLAKGLASQKDCTVYVLVLSCVRADEQTIAASRNDNIFLFWLDHHLSVAEAPVPAMTHQECAKVTHIVGHAHITGPAAKKISDLRQFSHAAVWQFNHVTPALVDVLKEAGSAQQRFASSVTKEHEIAALNNRAHGVFSVGELMYRHFCGYGLRHKRVILPLNPLFRKTTVLDDFPRDVIRVLYFGRTEGVYFVKGVDIAVRACERVFHRLKTDEGRALELTVQGTPTGKEADTLEVLRQGCAPAYRDFCPRIGEFASPEEVEEILTTKTSLVIMPSRVEPFGLVAMEAIACGVPVLVSDNSGVAMLLKESRFRFGHLCVRTSVVRPGGAEPHDNLEADIGEWERAILAMIHRGPQAFQDAQRLRDALQRDDELNHVYRDLVQSGREDILRAA